MRLFLMFLKRIFIEIICWSLLVTRELLGPVRCRYSVGCTKFALRTLRSLALHRALWLIIRRLFSCCSWRPMPPDLL